MKTLSEACKNTLTTARETTSLPVQPQYSLTNGGGKMIMTAQQLAQKEPIQNDRRLTAYLKHTLSLSMNVERESRFTAYGWEAGRFKVDFGTMTKEQLRQAKQAVDSYCAPLDTKSTYALIARLQMITPERQRSIIDTKARAKIWCEELSKYPADVVVKVLKERYEWFPSLAEVLNKCDDEIELRRLLKEKLRCANVAI